MKINPHATGDPRDLFMNFIADQLSVVQMTMSIDMTTMGVYLVLT